MKERVPGIRAVLLVGFMGAGKTSVGRALSAQMGWPFEDLDDRIRSREGRTIGAIFRESGEAEFRRIERATLLEMISSLDSLRIVGLGGGAFVKELDDLLTRPDLVTVFLDAPVEELWRRCEEEANSRPLQREEQQFRALYESRRPQYLKASMHVNTMGKPVETVAAEVGWKLGLLKKIDPKESQFEG